MATMREEFEAFFQCEWDGPEMRPDREYWAIAWQAASKEMRERCAEVCDYKASIQDIRSSAEGNNYAAERSAEAYACANAIRSINTNE